MKYVIEKSGQIVYGPEEWRPHGDLAKRAGLRGNAAPALPLAVSDGETLRALVYKGDLVGPHWTLTESAPTVVNDAIQITRTRVWHDDDTIRDARLVELAAKRWTVETAGLTLPDGTVIATDDRAKILLGNARMLADAGDPADARQIKAASGWVSLTNTEILALWQAVATHVQACFDAEKAHDDALRALTDPARIAGYDISIGWPGA